MKGRKKVVSTNEPRRPKYAGALTGFTLTKGQKRHLLSHMAEFHLSSIEERKFIDALEFSMEMYLSLRGRRHSKREVTAHLHRARDACEELERSVEAACYHTSLLDSNLRFVGELLSYHHERYRSFGFKYQKSQADMKLFIERLREWRDAATRGLSAAGLNRARNAKTEARLLVETITQAWEEPQNARQIWRNDKLPVPKALIDACFEIAHPGAKPPSARLRRHRS